MDQSSSPKHDDVIMKSKDHTGSNNVKRLVSSYGYDFINGIIRGKVVTLKHFLLGVGLHNMTGLKLPIKVLSHQDHSIDYDLVLRNRDGRSRGSANFVRKEGLMILQKTQYRGPQA